MALPISNFFLQLTYKSADLVPAGLQAALTPATLPRRNPDVPARVRTAADSDARERVLVTPERKCAALRAGGSRNEGVPGQLSPAAASRVERRAHRPARPAPACPLRRV